MKRKKLAAMGMVLCMAAGLLGGCGKSNGGENQEKKSDVTTIKWYMPAYASKITPEAFADVKTELNKQLEDIQVELELVLVEPGDYDQKMQMVMASNEPYDLCFTSSWMNSFVGAAGKGAFLPLEDYLDEYAPDIKSQIEEYGWDAFTIKGHVYSIPNRQSWARTDGYYVRSDYAEKYKYTPALDTITQLEDLEGFFKSVKEGEDTVYGTYIDSNYKWGYNIVTNGFDEIAGRNIPGVVKFNDENHTVINQFETEEFKQFAERMKKWNDEGYIRKDSATYALSKDAISKDLKSGNIATEQLGMVAPHVAKMAQNSFDNKTDVLPLRTSEKMIVTSSIQASSTAVGVNSKNPQKAVQVMNKVYGDPKFYNTFLYGVEGKHYEKIGENQVKLLGSAGYGDGTSAPLLDWAVGNQFNSWVIEGSDADIWNKNKEWEADATPSDTIGFSFDQEPVKTEIANVTAVIDSDLRLLDSGSVEVDTFLPEFINKLKQAGSDKIIAECQKQLDEWYKTK